MLDFGAPRARLLLHRQRSSHRHVNIKCALRKNPRLAQTHIFSSFLSRRRSHTSVADRTKKFCTASQSRRKGMCCVISPAVDFFLHRHACKRPRASGIDQKRANRASLIRSRACSKCAPRRPTEGFCVRRRRKFSRTLIVNVRTVTTHTAHVTARVSSSAARSRPAGWPCRLTPSSPDRRTSRSPSDWIWRQQLCPGSCR